MSYAYDTDLMAEWATKMDDNTQNYDSYIGELYNLVNTFANSDEFKGDLAEGFKEKFDSFKPKFDDYTTTLEDCIGFINEKRTQIEEDDTQLINMFNNANPL